MDASRALYETLTDGRFRISGPALAAFQLKEAARIVETILNGWPARVLLLDKPLQLGDRVEGTSADEYYLRRIRVRELPGWPPRLVPTATDGPYPAVQDCRLMSARLHTGSAGQEGVELRLDFDGAVYRAWHVGCPVSLLKFEEATLRQDEAAGQKLLDLQEMRLIG